MSRELELKNRHFNLLLDQGAHYARWIGPQDIQQILDQFATLHKMPLSIQREIVDEGKQFNSTGLGMLLDQDAEVIRAAFTKQLEDLENSTQLVIQLGDNKMEEILQASRQEIENSMRLHADEQNRMQ
ncbi:hypothetical protein HDU98_007029, partial [Podochytrium sp. JEL0797]